MDKPRCGNCLSPMEQSILKDLVDENAKLKQERTEYRTMLKRLWNAVSWGLPSYYQKLAPETANLLAKYQRKDD